MSPGFNPSDGFSIFEAHLASVESTISVSFNPSDGFSIFEAARSSLWVFPSNEVSIPRMGFRSLRPIL